MVELNANPIKVPSSVLMIYCSCMTVKENFVYA